MTSEYRLLPVEWLTEIWRPDSFFKNAKSVTFQTMTIPNHYIWLYKDKSILYMVKWVIVWNVLQQSFGSAGKRNMSIEIRWIGIVLGKAVW